MGIARYFKLNTLLTSSIDLLIAYRNNLLHYFAENEILDDHSTYLRNQANIIHTKYSGLDIMRLLEKYKKGEAPTFKEVASLTQMSHDFVEAIDFQIINNLSPDYTQRAILIKFSELQVLKQKYLAGNSEDRVRIVKSILSNYYSYNSDDFFDMDFNELIRLLDSGVLKRPI